MLVWRGTLISLPGEWLESVLAQELWAILEIGGAEEYRRLAKLFAGDEVPLLAELGDKAQRSRDPDVQKWPRTLITQPLGDLFTHRQGEGIP